MYELISDFNEYGFAIVELNGRYNLIDTNGNFISQQWFDLIDIFTNGNFCAIMSVIFEFMRCC